MNTNNFLWLAPFFISISSYLLLNLFIPHKTIIAPSVIGKSLHEALGDLSACGLNTRIVSYKQDPDVPQGTVLSQSPRGNKYIKPGQTMLIAVSEQPPQSYAPSLHGLTENEIIYKLKNEGLIAKFFNVISPYPFTTCVAHIPES